MTTNISGTNVLVDAQEAFSRIGSYADPLEMVQALKGSAALVIQNGALFVDLEAVLGDVCEVTLPVLEVIEEGILD